MDENLIITKEASCSFTGHRPAKLHTSEAEVKAALEREIDSAIASGYRTFITGMSTGVDLWAGEIVLRRMQRNKTINIIAALPYSTFGSRMAKEWKTIFDDIMNKAIFTKTISPQYHIGVYQARDKWMVDNSSRVIAVFNGEPGGTKFTIEYAERSGVEVIRAV